MGGCQSGQGLQAGLVQYRLHLYGIPDSRWSVVRDQGRLQRLVGSSARVAKILERLRSAYGMGREGLAPAVQAERNRNLPSERLIPPVSLTHRP